MATSKIYQTGLVTQGILTLASGFYAETVLIPRYVIIQGRNADGTRMLGSVIISGNIKPTSALTSDTTYTIATLPVAAANRSYFFSSTTNGPGTIWITENSTELKFIPSMNIGAYNLINVNIFYCF